MIERADFIAAARGWLGVPFKHQGRSRAGVDCAGFVICLARELGLVPADFDINGYRRVPDGTMLEACHQTLQPAAGIDDAHVLVLRFSVQPQHVAIPVPYRHGGTALLHALQQARGVVEHRLDATWRGRIVGAYRFEGVA